MKGWIRLWRWRGTGASYKMPLHEDEAMMYDTMKVM